LAPGSAGDMSSPSHEGSQANANNSDGGSRFGVDTDDEVTTSDLDSTRKPKVTAVAATAGMIVGTLKTGYPAYKL
jgi:hypothetical protein